MQTELRLVRYATDEYNPNQPNYGIHPVLLDDSGKVIGRAPGEGLVVGDNSDQIVTYLGSLLDAMTKPVVDDANRTEGLVILYDVPAPAEPVVDQLSNQEYV